MRRFSNSLKIFAVSMSIFFITVCAWSAGGPILYFSFDEAIGDMVMDMSGGGHNGILKEGSAIVANPRKMGAGALQIEGENETMEVETFAKLETYTDHTYAFWIYFTAAASGGWDQIIAKPAPDSDRSPGLWVTPEGLSIHWRYNPDNLGPWGITKSGNQNADFFEENIWYHVAGAVAGEEIVCYVNGDEVHRDAVPAEFAQGAREDMAGLYVGKSQSYSGPAAKFVIDDLIIYDRALNQGEVEELMGGVTPVEAKNKLTSTWGTIKGK
jgi:hypothetical protein